MFNLNKKKHFKVLNQSFKKFSKDPQDQREGWKGEIDLHVSWA